MSGGRSRKSYDMYNFLSCSVLNWMEVTDSIHAPADLQLRDNTLYPFALWWVSERAQIEESDEKIAAVTEEWSLSFTHGQVHNGWVIPCRKETVDLYTNSAKYYNSSITYAGSCLYALGIQTADLIKTTNKKNVDRLYKVDLINYYRWSSSIRNGVAPWHISSVGW